MLPSGTATQNDLPVSPLTAIDDLTHLNKLHHRQGDLAILACSAVVLLAS
jgi:hypothetical protein